ncbi:DUF7149 domain-containing protein [Campylobacter jejuni]
MHFTLLNEKDFFNPYYRKKQIMQNEFDIFSKALMQYLERLERSQSENEDYLVANALSPFLTMLNFKTHIKTKQKGKSEIDLAISKDEFSKYLEVFIEAKKPNSKEFITHTKVNSKALHETILYYFRNREYSFSLKFIIITDFYKFYIFKISEFEELFYKNPSFKKLFEEFCNPNSLFKGNTEEFYKEVAKLIENSKENLKGFLIDLTFLKDKQKSNFKNLASIYKTFHRDFLLSEFNPNDANSLNNAFYKELLYILGLCESKQNSKLIIGNPPYIRQEELKELKPHLAKNYKVYKGTSDIYTYFYELGFNVLKDNGVLSYITSNKYTRAGYGEALREFLLKNVKVLEYTDLNGIKVFDSATVDTSILCFEKSKSKDNKFKYLALSNEILKTCAYDIGLYKDYAEFSQNSLSKESFTFSDENTSALKAKIERIGTPLKEWQGLNIYRGILTGYNEAFIITTEKRNEILANCKDEAEKERTAKLIRKMLRGRDIKRYSYEWAGLWVINTHNGYKNQNGEKVEAINIKHYPSLKKHFDEFYPQLEKRADKGLTPYNLRNCAYIEEFEKEKIVYPCIMAKEPCFSYETSFAFAMAPANIITSNSDILKYILAFLNSDFIYLMLRKFYMGGGIEGELKTNNLEKLPIPKINSKNQKLADELINLVDEILKAKEQDKNANTQELENKINSLVYKLYNLTEEEIKIIEGR